MPAPWDLVTLVRASLSLLSLFGLFKAALPAQTSIDDIHIAPRAASVRTSEAANGLHVIRTGAQLVLVPVSVTDSMQRFVIGLNQENFQVFEGKKPQTIQNFSREDMPASIGIILDMSGSMKDKIERLREAVTQFCEAANPRDEFFMIVFSDQPRLAIDFTSSSDDIEHELVFTQAQGRTSLLDAIHMGLRKMEEAKYGKRALLIVSDGGDNHSRHNEQDIRALTKESDVMIYSIGLFDRYVPTAEEMRGPALLSEIAEPTGGRAYTLDNPNEMPALARRIGLELRTQYVLAYRPQTLTEDGKWHKIKVKLMLPRKFPFLRARARTGYYASAER